MPTLRGSVSSPVTLCPASAKRSASHLAGIGIESRDFVPRFGEAQRQGQADVAAANDSHSELAAFEKLGFPVDGHEFRRIPRYVGPQRGQGIHVYGDTTPSVTPTRSGPAKPRLRRERDK